MENRPTVLYRLPTEAEWGHACRAGSVHKHVGGPEPGDLADYAWTQEFLDPNPQASPLHLVAQKKPNPFGLHDTLGNVWERTRDHLSPALVPYLGTNNPLAVSSPGVLGVAWERSANIAHPDWGYAPHELPSSNVGFRVLKQFDGEPLPGPLDRPLVLRAGQPLSVPALVPRPENIPGLQSWSVELAGPHTNQVRGIAVSPKGDMIATGSMITGKISLWDRDGQYKKALLGHEGIVGSLDFSPDGRWLATCDHGGKSGPTARIWNVEIGALQMLIPLPAEDCNCIRFSPDGKQLAVSIDAQYQTSFCIIDLATGRLRLPSTGEQRGRGLEWSPDSSKLASLAADNHLRIWDVDRLVVLREIDCPAAVTYFTPVARWSPDGEWLATQTADGKVAIRNAKTLEVTKTFGASAWPIAWLPDSRRLAVRQNGSPSGIFDITTGEQLTKFETGPGHARDAVFDQGQQVVFESGSRLFFYDTSTGQKLREGKERAQIHADLFNASVLAPNAEEVFSINPFQAALRVFDAATGAERRRVPTAHLAGVILSPNAALFAAAWGEQNLAFVVDSRTGTTRHELRHGNGNVTRVAWSSDGKWLATGATDKLVRVWDVATGKIEHELAGHTGTIIWSLAWSPDGTRLASAAEDKTVRLWDPSTGKLVATYDQFPEEIIPNKGYGHALAWTADSRRLWIVLTNHIAPLDVATGTFGPLENYGEAVQFLNMSPDGQRLLAREVKRWTFVRGRDAQDRRLLGQHLGSTAQWHPDSRRFLGWEPDYGTIGFDVETNRRLGLLFPWLTGDHWLCVGPTGHYRGSPGVEDQFVYVAMLPDGSQRTYTPAEFAKKFGWKNDPEKAELLGK